MYAMTIGNFEAGASDPRDLSFWIMNELGDKNEAVNVVQWCETAKTGEVYETDVLRIEIV